MSKRRLPAPRLEARFLVILIVLLLVGGAGCAGPDHRAAADAALAEGDFSGAIAALKQLHEGSPDDPDVLFDLGCIYYRLGQAQVDDPELGDNPGLAFDESVYHFRRALEADSAHQAAHLMLAESLFMNGDLEAARAAARSCCTNWADLGRAHELAGKIALTLAQRAEDGEAAAMLEEATASLERAIGLDSSLDAAHLSLGDCFLQKGDVARAADVYFNGVVHCPEANDLHGRLIHLNGAEGGTDPGQAIAFYEKQLERAPTLSAAALGRLWWFKGSWHGYEGIAHYGAEDFEAAAEAYGKQLECLQRSVMACPEFEADGVAEGAKVRLNRGWCLIRLEQFEEARRDVFACLDIFPEDPNLILAVDTLGWEISQKKGYEAAHGYFEALTKRYGGRHQWWNDYGFFSLELNMRAGGTPERYGKTLAIYERALELKPDYPRYLNDAAMLIDYYLDPGKERREKVEKMYRTAWIQGKEAYESPFRDASEKAVMFSAFTDALVNLTRLCIQDGRRDEARKYLEELLGAAPDRQEALVFKRVLEEDLPLQDLYQPPSRKE